MFGTLNAARLTSEDRLFLFAHARRDTYIETSIGTVVNRFSLLGLKPLVRLSRITNSSTVGLYAYRQFRAQIGLTHDL
jgi:hypothetical protein